MVYGKFDETFRSTSKDQYAGPFARAFSALLDYFIFFPVVTFLMTILFKNSIAVASGKMNVVLVQILIFYILLFTLLQTVFIYFHSATPGQSFLKLYFRFEVRQSNLFFQIWFRQIGFVFSFFLLGLPFLAIFYHLKQRTFYDRLAECDILTRAPSEDYGLQDMDKRYLASGVSLLICCFSTIILISMIQSHVFTVHNIETAQTEKEFPSQCIVMDQETPDDRLKSVLALGLMNRLDEECVFLEADMILEDADSDMVSLAYFAKYALEKNAEDKKKYYTLACKGLSPSDLCEGDRSPASTESILRKLIK